MLVIGIDPGAVFTGFAWIREAKGGAVERSSSTIEVRDRYPFRYPAYERALIDQFARVPEEPSAIAVEEPDHDVWKDNDPFPVFHLHGIYAATVCAICRRFKDSILHHLRPGSWKGHMPKEDTARGLREKYGWTDVHAGDEADALGLADFAFEIAKKTRTARVPLPPPAPARQDEFGRFLCVHCGEPFWRREKKILVGADGKGTIVTIPFCRPCAPLQDYLTGPNRDSWIERLERIVRVARNGDQPAT